MGLTLKLKFIFWSAGILHRAVWYVAINVSKSPSTFKVAFLENISKPHQSIRYNSPENNNKKEVKISRVLQEF
jgi:hypothetical protein